MSFLSNIILSLPTVKKKIESLQKDHRQHLEKALKGSTEEKTKMRSELMAENEALQKMLGNEDVIMNKYKAIKDKRIILDTKVVHVKKQKAQYNLILVKTCYGDFKINVGRHSASGVGLGEHDQHHEPVKI